MWLIALPLAAQTQPLRGVLENSPQVPEAAEMPRPIPGDRVLEPGRTKIFGGMYLGLSINAHSGEFALVEDGVRCCDFDGGGGVGGVIGARGDYFLERDSRYGFSGRISYEGHGGGFDGNVERLPIFGRDNLVEEADFQHSLDVSLGTLDFSGLFMYKIGRVTKREIDIYASAGPSLWFHLSRNIDKTTDIISPVGVTYLDGTTSKTFTDLEQDMLSAAGFGLLGGFNIRYELRDSYYFGWEFLYRLPFTDVSGSEDWSVSNLLLTVGLSREF